MLTSLLPGLRELRAPFAAGVLWALAAWIRFEPLVPLPAEAKTAKGLTATLYRLVEILPPTALGVAAGFVVYLTGSLSVALLSDLLRPALKAVVPEDNRPFRALTDSSGNALRRLARHTRKEIESTLGPRGKDIRQFLAIERDPPPVTAPRWAALQWRRATGWIRELIAQSRQKARRPRHGNEQPDAIVEAELIDLALGDLDMVATARLLGKDQELFSAIDRHRAEVDFRLGVVPPLLVVFVVTSLRMPSPLSATLVSLCGVAAMAGLCWDALKQQRVAYGVLLGAAADNRLKLPSLERLLNSARSASEMKPDQASWRLERDMARSRDIVRLLDSFSSSAERARNALEDSTQRFKWLEDLLDPSVRVEADRALTAMRDVTDLYFKNTHGEHTQGWTDRAQTLKDDAEKQLMEFSRVVHQHTSEHALA